MLPEGAARPRENVWCTCHLLSFFPNHTVTATVIDRQDYFGRTVNIASRAQGLATSRSIFATKRVVADREASKLLQSNGIAATPEKRSLRGIAKQIEIFEIP
jgi:class 3 adenylate cyclase